jgi:hypothetical protein
VPHGVAPDGRGLVLTAARDALLLAAMGSGQIVLDVDQLRAIIERS